MLEAAILYQSTDAVGQFCPAYMYVLEPGNCLPGITVLTQPTRKFGVFAIMRYTTIQKMAVAPYRDNEVHSDTRDGSCTVLR